MLYTPKVVSSSVAEDVCSLLWSRGCPSHSDVRLLAVGASCESWSHQTRWGHSGDVSNTVSQSSVDIRLEYLNEKLKLYMNDGIMMSTCACQDIHQTPEVEKSTETIIAMCKHALCLRCTSCSTPRSNLLLVSASNSNAGAIRRSGSHKCWRSQPRWDGDVLNLH